MPNLYNHTVKFTVTGSFPFPIDMLRYDRCIPVDGISHIAASMHPEQAREMRKAGRQFEVTLVREGVHRLWSPTAGRWASFGWSVASVEEV